MNINFQNLEQLNECLEAIVDRIDRRAEKISNRELLEMCSEANDFLAATQTRISAMKLRKRRLIRLSRRNTPKSCNTVLKLLNGTSVDVNLIIGTKRLAEQTVNWQFE